MNRTEALKIITNRFPKTETVTGRDYLRGGTKEWVVSPEFRLKQMIDLFEPTFDGLKEGNTGIDPSLDQFFIDSVEHDYKNENGLW